MPNTHLVPVWIKSLRFSRFTFPAFHVSSISRFLLCSFLFFFFPTLVSTFRDRIHCSWTVCALFTHCSNTVHMGPTTTLLKKIKNGSHSNIHTFKNYFVTVFSVFSFSKNKFNLNEPLIGGMKKWNGRK